MDLKIKDLRTGTVEQMPKIVHIQKRVEKPAKFASKICGKKFYSGFWLLSERYSSKECYSVHENILRLL